MNDCIPVEGNREMDLASIGAIVAPLIGSLTIITGPHLINPAQLGWQTAASAINEGYPVLVQTNSSAERSAAGVRLHEAGANVTPRDLAEENVIGVTPMNRASLMSGIVNEDRAGGMIFIPDILAFGGQESLADNLAALSALAALESCALLTCVTTANGADLRSVGQIQTPTTYRSLKLVKQEAVKARVTPVVWERGCATNPSSGLIWLQKMSGLYALNEANVSDRRSALPGHGGRVTRVEFRR